MRLRGRKVDCPLSSAFEHPQPPKPLEEDTMLTLLLNSLAILCLKQSERIKRGTHRKVRGLPPMSDHLLRDIGLFDSGTWYEEPFEEKRNRNELAKMPTKPTEGTEGTTEQAPEPPLQKLRT